MNPILSEGDQKSSAAIALSLSDIYRICGVDEVWLVSMLPPHRTKSKIELKHCAKRGK